MRTALFLILSVSWVIAQPKLPTLLEDALRKLPGVHVLEPSLVNLPGGGTVDELKRDGYWHPWAVGDLDRDGLPDVVAAVVQRTPTGAQYGVLAVHAHAPQQFHWVVQLDTTPINGVVVGGFFGPHTVEPLYCYPCDANPWFRWSGRSYEFEFCAIGERIQVVWDIYALPSSDAKKFARPKACTNAKVISFRGTSYETRWYFVELLLSKPVRGWIPAEAARFKGDCFADGK